MTTKYILDAAHSNINFSIKHMMISKVHGSFEKVYANFSYDPQNLLQSKITATIETNSISTKDAQRDTHLKSADFFDVEKYPTITFESTSLIKENGNMIAIGNLTIKDVTKEVKLLIEGPSAEMKDPWGNMKIGASAQTQINRKDFNLTWNAALETGGFLVGEDVKIELDVQFAKES